MGKIYGDFARDSSDMRITTPDIPRNWYNYFWNNDYITFTSQAGAGDSFAQDAMGRRIKLVKDRGVFLMEDGRSWGVSGLPVNSVWDSYLCTHKRGCSVIETEACGISSAFTVTVPREGLCELWSLRIKNNSDVTRTLGAVAFFGTDFDGAYQRQGYSLCTAEPDGALGGIVCKKYMPFGSSEKRSVHAFFAMSGTPDGYDCTHNAVIGPYGSFAHPVVCDRGGCTNSPCCGEKMAFALQKNITLAAGEAKEIVFICGIAFSADEALELKSRFDSPGKFAAELEAVLGQLEKTAEDVRITTPDAKLNNMFEWLKHQSILGSRWARVRHNGFRDLTSDTDCLAAFNPRLALERFERILSYQYSNGYAPRTFIDGVIRDKNFADNTVWLTFTAESVIKELGDISILDREVAYNDGTVGSIYEHLKRSVEFLYNFRGLHGLIRIWGGDWNDCMDTAGLGGKGVSVWLSIAWYRANRIFSGLAELYGRAEDADTARQRGEEMRSIIEEYGWDGEYYLDAYNDDDVKIGSHVCEEGRMFLIPQIWAVLSGVSKDGREVTAMESAEKYLSSPLGTRISVPPYTKLDKGIGSVTTKPAGVHENGGVYLHTIAWKVAADAMLGRADRVEQDIETILPFRNKVVDGRAEPYIMCNSYFGEETGYRYGTPGQSWRTAAGQWFQKALINYVFGLIPEMDGLRVSPCLPPSWKECGIVKRFRGCTYKISYLNGGTRVKSITVNGKEIEGSILPIIDGEAAVTVVTE